MPLTPQQKDIAYVALLVAISQPRPAGTTSYLELLRAHPNPSAIAGDDQAKNLLSAVDTALYNEVHGKVANLNPNGLAAVRTNLSRIATNMTGATGLLRDNHPWDPNTVCGGMQNVIGQVEKITA